MKISTVACVLMLVGTILMLLELDLAFGGCIDKERHALLELKASLVLDDTSLLSTWDSKSDCCVWEQIKCNNQTGHVETLLLDGPPFGFAPFRGEINESLMELRHLKHLDISWSLFPNYHFPEIFGSLRNLRILVLQASFFGGRIPTDLFGLSHLQYLDISQNALEGTIPHQLGSLTHLHHLDLSNNSLVGSIPRELGYLSHLKYLDLSSNYLAGAIPHHLGRLSDLQKLHLGDNEELTVRNKNNHIGGQWLLNLTLLTQLDLSDVQDINSYHAWLQMIGKFPKLEELRLSYCDLFDRSVPDSVSNISKSLRILDFEGNYFLSSKIFEWVFNSTSNLIEFDLSNNIFKGPIPYDFGNIRNPLERLDLSSNELQGGTLEPYRNICTIHSLNLGYTNLSEDISTTLLKLFGCAIHSLQHLSLKGNKITGTFPNLSIFQSLRSINLSKNLLGGKLPDENLFLPSKLESLKFGFNSLEGGIPKSFGNLCSLRSLDMSNNKLSEDLSVIFHNLSVGCAKYSMLELDLSNNQIIGTFPDMSGFSSLKYLNLSHNLVNGKIPQNSTFPCQLKSLYLDFNKIGGVITDSHFGNMSMLKFVHFTYTSLVLKFSENWVPPFQLSSIMLGSCVLGASFPKWLHSQKYFQKLDISNAGISDVVPVWFWSQTTNVVYLNISHNNLTGTIPNLPIRFSVFFQGIMDSNQFEGSIPPFFRSATLLKLSKNKFSENHLFLCTNTTTDTLHVLDLSMNHLSKKLPDCWSHFKALEFLDLSDNSLSGEVPSSMGSLLQLRTLILRNNSFSGKLPFSLENCKRLFLLDLAYNSFSGPIPYWLGEQLKMLSLQSNNFYGILPQSLCYLINIELLDISENNLSGQIFKCLKNFAAMSQNVSPNSIVPNILNYTSVYAVHLNYEAYDLTASLMWKGVQRLFKNNKLILRSIDLSSNHLTGDIPEEIGNLIQLVSLNLSNNNLKGEITSKIGNLRSLEFLDLSRNHFSGLIPPSLSQMNFLSMLNFSDNQLSGSIPIGTQLQSFDVSSYQGNVDLCGKPLDKKCPGDEEGVQNKSKTPEETSPEEKTPIYWGASVGFITGFWGLLGSLLLIKTWRRVYVVFLNNIIDTVYVFIMVNATKLQKCLRGLQEKFI